MKPYKTFLFFLSVILLIFLVSLIFPKEGIKITDRLTLDFFSLQHITSHKEPTYKDISNIIDKSKALTIKNSQKVKREQNTTKIIKPSSQKDTLPAIKKKDEATLKDTHTISKQNIPDTAKRETVTAEGPTKTKQEKDIQSLTHPIEYPKGDKT